MPLLRNALTCSAEWDGFRDRVNRFIEAFPYGPLVTLNEAIGIVERYNRTFSYLNIDDVYSIPLMHAFAESFYTNSIPEDSCMYGVVNALYLDAYAEKDFSLLHTALAILGEKTRRNFDFIESSPWPIRSADIVRIIDDPSRPFFPLTPRRRVSDILGPLPMLLSSNGRELLDRRKHLYVWEIGVHASLSAEAITMLSLTRQVTHRRLIQDQYPQVLSRNHTFLCSEMYSITGCDVTRDSITDFFKDHIPWSSFSPSPVADLESMRIGFNGVVRDPRSPQPDLIVCTIPVLCYLFKDWDVPVIGYFGHPLLFMTSDSDTEKIVEYIDLMVREDRAYTTDPFLAMQYRYVVQRPVSFVRTLGLYTNKSWNPQYTDILVWERPHDLFLMHVIQLALDEHCNGRERWKGPRVSSETVRDAFVAHSHCYKYTFVSKSSLVKKSYDEFSKFSAVVLFPYDMDLVAFYELLSMRIPIFLPDSVEKYLFFQGHMQYDRVGGRWEHPFSPFNETSLDVTLEQLRFSDYFRFNVSGRFANMRDLLVQLDRSDLAQPEVMEDEKIRIFNFWKTVF